MASTSPPGKPVGSGKAPPKAGEGDAGSSRSGPAASTEDQPTIISRRPPLAASPKAKAEGQTRPLMSASTLLKPGTRLAHFEIREYIGGGGMGRVYRATDLGLKRSVALKILTRESSTDHEAVRRFLNEAQAAARLNHDNIAQVYYVGEENGQPFIVFEYIDGVNIRELVDQRGPLPLDEAVSYLLQVAQALSHVADRHVVHRDIKPSNVLITREGQAKVIDMGLARLENPEDSGSDLTASGVTLGTFDYISPEQARDPRNADVRSDTYSLGCTFFYMLAGRPPFPEGTVLQKLLQHQGDEPPDIRHLRPDLPEEVARVLHKMMAKDPRHRYQDSARLIEALLCLADLAGLQSPGPGRSVWVAPREPRISQLRRHAPWMAPVAALILIILLLDNLFWSTPAAELAVRPRIGRPVVSADGPFSKSDGNVIDPTNSTSGGTSGSASTAGDQPPPADVASEDVGLNDTNMASISPPSRVDDSQDLKGPIEEVDVARPNPFKELASRYSGQDGLRQEPSMGELLAAAPISMGFGGVSGDAHLAELSGAAGYAGGPTRVGPAVEQPEGVPGRRVLVVDPNDESEGRFATLAAACAVARDGDVVELAFDGRHPEKPLAISNLEVTIQAGAGFKPVVVFRPTEIDPTKYPHTMFAFSGGVITLRGLAVELDIPRKIPADCWSLFELTPGTTIHLDGCSLTIRNASDRQRTNHPEVAFLRLEAGPTFDAALAARPSDRPRRIQIELNDCVVRGEAVFLRAERPQPIDLTWYNGLLVTTERFLVVDGGSKTPEPGDTIDLTLTHLTAVVQAGMCRYVHTEFNRHQLNTDVECTASILMTANGPLIEQVGVDDVQRSLNRIWWRGDRNFYQETADFWVVRSYDPMAEPDPFGFDEWLSFWGGDLEKVPPRLGQVVWRALPEEGRPLHGHTPADYALDDSRYPTFNPALGAADDGQDAGCLPQRLPELPPELPTDSLGN